MTEKMKPSGFDYLGDIPINWDAKRFKYCVQICNGGEYADIEVEEGGYPVIGSGGEFARASKYCYCGESVLLGRKGTIDKPLYVNDAFWCVDTMFYTKAKPGMDPKFLYYCALGFRFDYYATATALPSMTQKDLGSEMIAVPPTHEQRAIADFLDARCAKIDSVIADIEKQIETLQKYKKSLITEAVTKGLDRSAPMKDSGIDWIGAIPTHWDTNRLRYVASVKTGPFGTQLSADEYVDEGVPIINVKNIGYGSILAEDLDFVPGSVADRLSVHRLKLDDIVFGRKGAVDKHAIITDEYVDWVQGSDCIRVRSNPEIDSGYLNYLFDSMYFGSYVMLYAVGATMPSMSSDILLNARILVPPVQEQKDIAAYLNNQCGKISAIITNKQAQLDTIRSHKKSLIYEYVTGKKRVTEVN